MQSFHQCIIQSLLNIIIPLIKHLICPPFILSMYHLIHITQYCYITLILYPFFKVFLYQYNFLFGIFLCFARPVQSHMPICSELTVSIIMQYFPKNLESIIHCPESRIQSPESIIQSPESTVF